jgi:hypothetical protein
MQLDSRTVRHAKIRDHHLVPAGSRPPEFSERDASILGLIGLPPLATQVARERGPDGRLVVDHQGPPHTFGGDLSKCRASGLYHSARLKPRLLNRPGEPQV